MNLRVFNIWILSTLAAGAAPAASPVAAYACDRAEGGRLLDRAGQAHGQMQGDAAIVPGGVRGNCLQVTRAGRGFVNLGDRFSFDQGDFSLALWVKTPPGMRNAETFVIGRHRTGHENGYWIGINQMGIQSREDRATFFFGPSSATVVSSAVVNDGRWHHLACVYRAKGVAELYVDGVLQGSTPSRAIARNNSPFLLGGVDRGSASPEFTGWLDEIEIYNLALGGDDVKRLYQGGAQPDLPPPPPPQPPPPPATEGATMVLKFADGQTQTVPLRAPASRIRQIEFR